MFELSGVNYEEVLEQGDSILFRVIGGSSYRGFELSGVRVIGGSSYRDYTVVQIRPSENPSQAELKNVLSKPRLL